MGEQRLVAQWARDLEALAQRIGVFVVRPAIRDRMGRFLHVTLAGTGRRNGWQLAEAGVGAGVGAGSFPPREREGAA